MRGRKGRAAQQGQAPDEGGLQKLQNVVDGALVKGLAVAEVPGLLVEAAGTAVGAAGDKEAHPDAGAVGNVPGLDGRIIPN